MQRIVGYHSKGKVISMMPSKIQTRWRYLNKQDVKNLNVPSYKVPVKAAFSRFRTLSGKEGERKRGEGVSEFLHRCVCLNKKVLLIWADYQQVASPLIAPRPSHAQSSDRETLSEKEGQRNLRVKLKPVIRFCSSG